jgi:hypothetical protein
MSYLMDLSTLPESDSCLQNDKSCDPEEALEIKGTSYETIDLYPSELSIMEVQGCRVFLD